MLAILWICFEQLVPSLVVLVALGAGLRRLWRGSARHRAARQAWLAAHQALEAELAAAVVRLEAPETLVAIEARLAAHRKLAPRRGAWRSGGRGQPP